MKPERVVVGTSSIKAGEIMRSLYEPFVRNGNPVYVMDERSAELVKYASNAFLATKISFINEMATICERVGADVDNVRVGMGKDSRIGSQFLYAGIGYGGSCFPKDVQAMAHTARAHDYDFGILQAVMSVNKAQGERFIRRVFDYYDNDVTGRTFAIWGLAFKANTDDIREAPALRVIEELLESGAQVVVYDPEAMENVKNLLGNRIRYAKDMYEATSCADALIISTEWNEFRNPNLTQLGSLLYEPVIFDGRNLFDPDKMAEAGYEYFSIGRKHQAPRARFQGSRAARSLEIPTAA
jgi:UDPglucose 6-dehydrogenase